MSSTILFELALRRQSAINLHICKDELAFRSIVCETAVNERRTLPKPTGELSMVYKARYKMFKATTLGEFGPKQTR